MTVAARPTARARALLAAAVAVVATVLSLAPTPAAAQPVQESHHPHPGRTLTVASYNLYLGADLSPLFAARSQAELVGAAATVYARMEATRPPERMRRIAGLLAEERPDVVGLQEVARWETGPLGGALRPTYDFLPLLLRSLAARGEHYVPVASNDNFTGQLPISATTQARFLDRDVILVRARSLARGLQVSRPQSGRFAAELTIPTAIPGLTFSVPRGWSSVDLRKNGRTVRFVNTHLEAFSPLVRAAQARELVAVVEASRPPVVLVGDLNSPPDDATGAYGLVRAAGLVDAWVVAESPAGGATSGQAPDLRNPVSELDSRIDFVLYEPRGLRAVRAEVIGDEQRDRTRSGLWPSDHAGVVATLRLTRR